MASGVDFAHLASGMNLAYPSTINGQEILEEDYNEDFEPTDEGLLMQTLKLAMGRTSPNMLIYDVALCLLFRCDRVLRPVGFGS